MTPVAVGVVAHHERLARAERLAESVGAEVVTVDEGGVGAGPNHEACYRWLAGSGSIWSVLLEDDASPVRGFRSQLGLVLQAAPTPVVGLYLGRSRPPQWQVPIARVAAAGHHFLLCDELLHHVAVAVRTEYVPGILDHLASSADYRAGRLPIDEAVGQAARERGYRVCYSQPSLCDHADLPTLIARHPSRHAGDDGRRPVSRRSPRRAWLVGGRDEWDGSKVGVIPHPRVPQAPPVTGRVGRRKGR